MSLRYRQQRDLRQIRRALRASDAHLWTMMMIFTKLAAGEDMPDREQMGHVLPGAVLALVCAVSAAACRGTRFFLALGHVTRHAGRRCLAACGLVPHALRRGVTRWLAADNPRAPISPAAHRRNV
jgi:hypothetical protein